MSDTNKTPWFHIECVKERDNPEKINATFSAPIKFEDAAIKQYARDFVAENPNSLCIVSGGKVVKIVNIGERSE